MADTKALVLTRKEKDETISFDMTFTVNGNEVAYDAISTNEKAQFVQALLQALGTLAKVTEIEMKKGQENG